MPEPVRVLTRQEVEEAREWIAKCYCDDAHTANAVAERLDALARSHEQLRERATELEKDILYIEECANAEHDQIEGEKP